MLRKIYISIVSLIILSGLVAPAGVVVPRVVADGQTVIINELMWMGSSASSADEWIELRNVTDQTVDVSNWTMTKKSSDVDVPMLTLPVGTNIPPGGILVVSNYANTSTSSVLNVVPNVVNTDVALSNSALQIKLFDSTQTLIDVADDGSGNPLAGALDSTKKLYASMERNPIPGDGTQGQNWHTASRGVGFKTGVVDLGTPGIANSNGVPVAHAGADQTGTTGQEINFDGSDSFDPELQPLTYVWDFGDGSTSSEATPKHSYVTAGVYTVTLIVSDGTDSASDTAKITISAAPAVSITPEPATNTESNLPLTTSATSCLGLHISELYPNPPGVDTDEFIELMNDSDEEITTGTCAVFTSVTRSYKIPSGTVVMRGGFLLLPKSQTRLTMNNGGTTIRLVDSDSSELDKVVYGTAREGMSWAKAGEAWAWTTQPTPKGKNILVAPTLAAEKAKTPKKTSTTKVKRIESPAQEVSLKEVQELDSSDRVIVEGVVTTPRDVLGSTTAFMQSVDGGISITIPNGEVAITNGQHIRITGTVRLKNGRRYVATAAKGLKILSTSIPIVSVTVPTDDVGGDQADQLVRVKGVVSLASGSKIEIDDGSGPVPIYIKSSTGIIRPKVRAGDTVEAVGIVSVSTSGIRILPRTQDDLHVERVLGAATVIPTQTISAPAASRSQTLWYWSFVVVGALGAGARPMVRWWKGRSLEKD